MEKGNQNTVGMTWSNGIKDIKKRVRTKIVRITHR